jgi:predicted nucleotidyltransferase
MIESKQILLYLSENKERLFNEFQLEKIGIFGSTARGEQDENSDVDLIVEFCENTPDLFTKKNKLRKEIENIFNVPVDICREKYIKPYFKNQILAETIYV